MILLSLALTSVYFATMIKFLNETFGGSTRSQLDILVNDLKPAVNK